MVRFSKLKFENGRPVEYDVVNIEQDTIAQCPHFIFAPEHYRPDGTCRCNDKAHTEMKQWGYKWRDGQWR